MKFAIVGAGAMGCRFGYQLAKSNQEVILIDTWPEHIQAIRKHGLRVDYNGISDNITLPIYYPNELIETVDVIILLTKAMQLESMLQSIQSIIGSKTKVICLLNGIGHEELIKQYVALPNIIMGTTIWTANLNAPGYAHLHGVGNLALQNFVEDASLAQETKAIINCLNLADLCSTYSDDVKTAIWRKACVNGCGNALPTLLECTLGDLFAQDNIDGLVTPIIQEFSLVAKTQGVYLDVKELSDFVITASRKVGEHYPSMYQDLIKNKRYTEVDYINGAVSRLGKLHHISTPINDFITQIIHVKENLVIK